jgi:hypothetical protein
MSPRRPRRDDAGFTLVELLVVVIVTPLVIGALAEAFIVTLQQDTNNKNRLTDSANAQITSAYFVRDVQGASEITTFDYQAPLQLNGPPQVCGPGLGTLVVAFFHPPTSANPALDVSYRVQGNQIKRYSCTYNQATNTSTAPVGVLISDDLGTAANDLQVDISPSQFCGTVGNPNCPASTGWMSIAASNGLASTQNLSSSTIYVDGVTGFVPNQPITVYSTTGPVQITCGSVTAGATPNFGSCTGGPNATGLTGATVTQGSVSEVQISINQPSSSYRYALTGSPRSSTLADLGACSTCGQFPALLTLGNNPGAHFNGTTSLNVTGGMMVDGGQLGCTGTPSITVSGGIAITGSTSNTCTSQTVATQPFVQDPIEGQLPTPCFPQLAASPTDGSSTGTLQPGRYTSQISFNTGTTYLRPGVYELDGGIDLHGGGNLAMAPGTPVGQGVLLYVPGPGSPTEPSGCAKTAPQTINMGGGSTLHLPPLGTAPVPASLSNVPVLQQMWIWEDGSVPSGTTASLSGNNTAGQPAGLAYLPGTNVTLFGTPGEVTGKIIAANLTLGGTATVVVQGY